MARPSGRSLKSSAPNESAGLARLLAGAALALACTVAAATSIELGSYEVTVNSRAADEPVLVARDAAGRLFLDEAALRKWRVAMPATGRVEIDGLTMIALDAIPGTVHRVDERRQSIALDFAPERLAGTRFAATAAAPIPFAQAPRWGGFLNYSLFGHASDRRSEAAGLFEAGLFGPHGTGIASFGANTATTSGTTDALVRFETSWRRDDPATMRSLVVGDSISRPGFYGRPVRFGGVQYGKNFLLQPGYVTTPLLAFSGTAAVPSTVDVFVNNRRISSQPVEPGPFTIENVPAVSGSGTVQLIVRDAFGRQQVISDALYGSPTLLAPGLDDYALSVGAQRRNYGIDSFDYGGGQAMALWRRGLTRALTVEGHAEADRTVASAGAAGDFLVRRLGIASIGAAASSGDAGSGALWMAGFDHQRGRFSAGVRGTFTSAGFRQVGDDGRFATPQRSVTARAAVGLGHAGSVGVAVASRRYHDPLRPAIDTGALTWSRRFGTLGSLTVSLSRVRSDRSETTLFAALSIPIGRETTASAASIGHSGTSGSHGRQSVSIQKALPAYGDGYGFMAFADTDRRAEAGAIVATRFARISADLADVRGVSAVRAAVEGGIGTLGGHTFMSRPIVDSFAIVSTGGVAGIEVRQENQPVGRTDRNGLLVLTPLRAYVPNHLSIDPLSVPMNVGIGASAQRVTPAWRSGTMVGFEVARARSALVRVQAADGSPLPSTARVVDATTGRTLPVGLDGEIFVSGLPTHGTDLLVEHGTRHCRIAVTPEGDDAVLDLGPYVCRDAS